MAKKVTKSKSTRPITPEEALDFLESFRKMKAGQDAPTQAISLRVPANILKAYKTLARSDSRAYQSMMIQALRDYLEKAK